MPKTIRSYISKANVHAALADGYTFARPTGKEVVSADGKVWIGDAVIMEISEEQYKEIQERRLSGPRELSAQLRKGQLPLDSTLPEGFTASFTSQPGGVSRVSQHVPEKEQ